jgi:hypothetical protein
MMIKILKQNEVEGMLKKELFTMLFDSYRYYYIYKRQKDKNDMLLLD